MVQPSEENLYNLIYGKKRDYLCQTAAVVLFFFRLGITVGPFFFTCWLRKLKVKRLQPVMEADTARGIWDLKKRINITIINIVSLSWNIMSLLTRSWRLNESECIYNKPLTMNRNILLVKCCSLRRENRNLDIYNTSFFR